MKNYRYVPQLWERIQHYIPPLLRIRDVHPGSRILIFTHPGSKNSNKREGWKNLFFHTFFVATNFTNLNIITFLICWRKKFWPNFPRIIKVFTQKIVTKLSKVRVWDPRSGTREKPIPDPGSRGQKGTGSRIRIRNTILLSNFHNFIAIFYSARRKSFQGVLVTDFKALGGWTVEKNESLIK
jgi:hypothetical protein